MRITWKMRFEMYMSKNRIRLGAWPGCVGRNSIIKRIDSAIKSKVKRFGPKVK